MLRRAIKGRRYLWPGFLEERIALKYVCLMICVVIAMSLLFVSCSDDPTNPQGGNLLDPPTFNGNDYFPIAVGNIWTHSLASMEVVDETRAFVDGTGQRINTTFVSSQDVDVVFAANTVGSGVVIYGDSSDGQYNDDPVDGLFILLPKDMSVGSTWNLNFSAPSTSSATLTLLGLESVTVAAGTYSNCLKIQFTLNDTEPYTDHLYFAKDVGLVKAQRISPAGDTEGSFILVTSDDRSAELQSATTWQTIFEDDFNSVVLDRNWTLWEGNTDNYVLNGSTVAMDDTPANGDGPLFLYDKTVTDNVIRVTCKLSTLAMSGEVEFAMGVRATDPRTPPVTSDIDQAYVGIMMGDELAIVKIVAGNGSELAVEFHPDMASNETRIMECRYENGTISFIVRDAGGNVIGLVTATDPSPLPAGGVGFIGEVDDGSGNEYLYVDDFKLEKYE